MHFPPFSSHLLPARHVAGGYRYFLATVILSILLLTQTGIATSANPLSIDARRNGDAVQVSVQTTIKAPLALIWKTLTDYDHLDQFIPGMNKSRLIERQDKTAIIEQSGYAGLWFFHFPIDVTVEVIEQPFSSIQVRLVKGNLKQLEGRYDIEKIDDDHYTLRWTGTIEPDVAVPNFLATKLMRKNISKQFLGMVNEIERRAALHAQAAAPESSPR